mmetsp:Transcript_7196/g.18880  ORF Transcript_7196/g.18880 Transcript_7196/m.18880 type:complete len:206 (+) Transcript_7196:309-926(+)
MHLSTSSTRAALIEPSTPRSAAAAPATCGVAMEVPEMVRVSESDEVHAAVMLDPGAWRSTQLPWLEKDDLASEDVVDPTVIASGADAGDVLQASPSSLPAAATTMTPASYAALTARFWESERPPPRDMEMTAGTPGWFCAASLTAHSMPALTPDDEPEPAHESTCTATRVVCLATPYAVPPIVEEQCVPWPEQPADARSESMTPR